MIPDGPANDSEVLMRIRGGDEQAFLSLYRMRQGAIYRFVLHMTKSPEAAEDITQEVFLALLRDECAFDAERGTLSGYLFGIARKLVLRQAERGRGDMPLADDRPGTLDGLPELAESGDLLEQLSHRERIDALKRAVDTLPRRYREVVVLCDLEEVDYAEAAVALGCPIGTVRSRLHRARSLLLEKLDRERLARPAVNALNPMRCTI